MLDGERVRMPPAWSRREIPSWLITLLVVGLAAVAAFLAGRSSGSNPTLLVMIFVAAPVLLGLFASSLEQAVIVFLVYATFEGLLKNISASNPVIYLLRDLFLMTILGKLLFGNRDLELLAPLRRARFAVPAVTTPIFLFILVSIVQIFNPSFDELRTNFVLGLGGIHQRILPMVLFFATLRFVHSAAQVEKLQRLLVYLGLVVAVVLILQVLIGPQRWTALGFTFFSQGAGSVFSPQAERAGVPRPASTGQDAGAAAWFILTAIFLSIGALTGKRVSGHSVMWQAAVTGFLLLALLLTFVRTAYMLLALGIGAFLLLRNRELGVRMPLIGLTAVVVVVALGSLVPDTYMEAINYRAQQSVLDPVAGVTTYGGRYYQLMEIPGYITQYPLGVGTGRTGPGVAIFARWFPVKSFGAENGFGAIILEGSVLAGGLLLWMSLAILARGLAIVTHIKDETLKAPATSMLVCVFATVAAMFGINPLDASPFNTYFWLLSGALMAIPKAEVREAEVGTVADRLRNT